MTVEHFLAWLDVADLQATGEDNLRIVMEKVLEAAPDDPGALMDSLLDDIEDQLDAKSLDTDQILSWPKRYARLFQDALSDLEDVEDRLEAIVDDVPAQQVNSPRLERFTLCLENLRLAKDSADTLAAWAGLEQLEQEIADAQAEYAKDPFLPEAVSAHSVAGHRLLQDGFECWLEAFDLAKVGQGDKALSVASEGNRLFRAVAEWSDEVAADQQSG